MKNSFSQQMNRNSTPKRVSPTNPRDVSPAVTLVKELMVTAPGKCLTLFALLAEQSARFPSSPEMTVLFIAAIAFLKTDKYRLTEKMRFRAHFFV